MAAPRKRMAESTDALRSALRLAIAARGLRRVAREVGMSASGLLRSLDESETWYQKTRRKFERWYLSASASSAEADAETARVALDVFLEKIPAEEREGAEAEFLDFLRTLHERRKAVPPGWIDALKETGDGSE